MREKFGLEFVIVDSDLLAQVRRTHGLAANPFRLFPRVIVSMAWLPTPRPQRMLRDILDEAGRRNSARRYAFDILVVDEAHHVAPSSPSAIGGGRGYALDSQRTMATRALAERCEHRLFLSATPHNGHSESFTALLEMIDNRRFSRGATIDGEALKAITVRRLKAHITDKGFLPREIKPIPFTPSADAEDAFATLDDILTHSAEANGRKRSGDILSLLLKKRFLSSPWAFASTLELYEASATTTAQIRFDDYYTEVLGSEQSDEEEGSVEHPEFETLARTKATDPLSAATPQQIDRLVAWGRGYEYKPDARLTALLTFLDAVCRPAGPKSWSSERVVVFTEYAATLEWVKGVLEQHGYDAGRLAVIQGSTPHEEREGIRARFTAKPTEEPLRVLIATDAAGEGIDLQDHCHRLVNIDIPFNPSRLEQRIGRIDRYGQRYRPEVYYFAPTETSTTYAADLSFMQRIAEKVSTVRSDLGSVNPLIDDEIQEHFGATAGVKRTARPDRGAETINRAMAGEQELNRSLTELSRTYADRKEAMHLTPFSARRVVDTALALSDQPLLEIVGDEETDAEVLQVGRLGPRWQPALRGLATRLRPDILRPITFDDKAAAGRDDLVHVHLGHAILQKSARMLRSSLFGSDSRVHRVTAVVVPGLPVSCVASVSRLVLVGRGGLRLHEEVFVTGIRIHGNAMAEDKVNDLLDRVLDAPDLELAPEAVRRALAEQWDAEGSRMRARLEQAMKRRAERKQADVAERLDARRDSDIARAHQIFAAFRNNLHDSLKAMRADEEEQLAMLFADDQQRQRQRDIRAMEERLQTLDDEEAREVDGIRDRYADIQPFVSAAAVVFALTPEDARTMGGQR